MMTSCYSSTIISSESSPDTIGESDESDATQEFTLHTYWWGAKRAVISTDKCPGGFYQVEVKPNMLNSLVNILSLGIYKRTKVECTCAKALED